MKYRLMRFPQGKTKAVTFSYDDCTMQDNRLVELFNKYNLKATFNVNSELLGTENELIRKGVRVRHDKIAAQDIKNIYSGHEVAVHTLTHPYLQNIEDDNEIIRQIEEDRKNLENLVEYEVCGMAYPGNGVKFQTPVVQGQKSGWLYDHRLNRARLAPYVKGKRVLDLFCNVGGWGVQAAAFGASEVFCVDGSAFALDAVERNAALNGVAEKITCVEGDIFEALKELKNAEERFDVVITDPPAFVKRKKDLKNGEAAYRRLNEQAMRLLGKDGILVSASCSMHLPEDNLQNILLGSARHLDRNIQLLERGGQGPDHPVHPAIPETRYIKSLICRLLPNA